MFSLSIETYLYQNTATALPRLRDTSDGHVGSRSPAISVATLLFSPAGYLQRLPSMWYNKRRLIAALRKVAIGDASPSSLCWSSIPAQENMTAMPSDVQEVHQIHWPAISRLLLPTIKQQMFASCQDYHSAGGSSVVWRQPKVSWVMLLTSN